jgi:hypothetical protein
MTIVNDDSGVINKLEVSLTDAARVVIYNHHMFIVQATHCDQVTKSAEKSLLGQY